MHFGPVLKMASKRAKVFLLFALCFSVALGQDMCKVKDQNEIETECKFPFLYKNVTYIGCTNFDEPDPTLFWCATKIDPDTLEFINGTLIMISYSFLKFESLLYFGHPGV